MATAFQALFTFLFKYPPRVFQRGDLVWTPVLPAAAIALAFALLGLLAFAASRALRGVRPGDRMVLAGLRIAAFAVIAACLLRPALAITSAVPQRNVLAVVLDDSRSMQIRDVDTARRVSIVRRTFADSAALMRRLSDRFTLRFFRFSGDAAPMRDASALSAAGTRTDVAASLESVRQELADAPVAGIVLVSDGADNAETDVAPVLSSLRAARLPVYTVGVGSERFARDLSVDRLAIPATTLQGSGALAVMSVAARGVGGDSATVTAEADGRIVARQSVALPKGRDLVDVPLRLPALDVGTHVIRVQIAPLRGEIVTENNEAEALLRVRPGVERVLYLEGEPRYEFGFLRRAFESDSEVRIVGLLRTAKGKFLRINVADSLDLIGGFPTRREDLFRYRMIILGDVEASLFSGDQLRMLRDFVDRRGGMLLALGGRNTLAEGGYAGTPVAEVLPVTLEHGGRPSTDTAIVSLRAVPTAAGLLNPAMQLGPTPPGDRARWDSLPVLTAVNRLGDLRPGAITLLDGVSAHGDASPLLTVQHYGRGMAGVLGAQDTWTWKMDPATPLGSEGYETFWHQLVRWSLDQVPERLDMAVQPERAGPGEAVTLRARLVDSDFVDVDDAVVTAEVTSPSGRVTVVPMDGTLRGDGTYTGHFVSTEAGTYRIAALAAHGRDSTRSAGGALLADPRGADMANPELRTALLQRIAGETGGRYFPIADLSSLPDDVALTSSGIVAHESRDLWDMPAVLLLLVLLLGADWGYRRWRGLA